MNHIYRSLWNDSTQTYVAVSEVARSQGRAGCGVSSSGSARPGAGFALKALAAASLFVCGTLALANPSGGTVSAGSATITSSGAKVTVTQGSQNAAINWQAFSIGSGESVQFVQPNAGSVALNRVVGSDPSNILGSLTANGQVFLVNPNGILFGKGGSVNVQGLVASTLGLGDADFMAGKYGFAGASTKSVANLGSVHADGGYVALLGAHVSNQGTIAARLGTVALVAGQGVTLDIAGDSLLKVNVDRGAVNALVENGGLLQADGGQVLMTAQAAGQLLNTVVNNTGVVQAQTVQSHGGVIKLLGDMASGSVGVGGTLDASAPAGGNGGFIETSAAKVNVAADAVVTTAAPAPVTGVTSAAPGPATGTWLIDPADYTIAATGGNMTGAALGTALASTDVTIQSTAGTTSASALGNIYVNDTVSWAANKLTLTAVNDIVVGSTAHNGILNATATGKLALNTASTTGASDVGTLIFTPAATPTGGINNGALKGEINLASTSTFSLNGTAYTIISSLGSGPTDTTSGTLQGVNNALGGHYVLGADINATSTSGWSGGSFKPLGAYVTITDPDAGGSPAPPYLDQTKTFSGVFEGLGHQITGLTVSTTAANGTGLFGVVGGQQIKTVGTPQTSGFGVVQDVTLVSPQVSGVAAVGALVGLNGGIVNNDYAIGTAAVPAAPPAPAVGATNGSVVGANNGSNYAIYVGGLVGENLYRVTGSYSSAAVSGTNTYTNSGAQLAGIVGGLVGVNADVVSGSSASGTVSGFQYVGGLAGQNGGTITNSSATGNVGAGATGGGTQVGGLVGINSGTITGTTVAGNSNTYSFATGNVTGTFFDGGLVGTNTGTIAYAYASGNVTATHDDIGGLVGLNQGGNGGIGHPGTASVNGSVGATGFTASITDAFSTGTVSGVISVGGLVGLNQGGNGGTGGVGCNGCKPAGAGGTGGPAVISQSYSTSITSGSNNVGGLVGMNASGTLGLAGAAVGTGLGGAAGSLSGAASITDTYASGTVTGTVDKAGGLVGYVYNPNAAVTPAITPASVATSYTTSTVAGAGTNHGLAVGTDSGGKYTNVYYQTQGAAAAFGTGSSGNVSGLSAAQIAVPGSFGGFNFQTTLTGGIWGVVGANTHPTLCALTAGCTVDLYIEVVTLVGGAQVTGAQASVYGNSVPAFQDILVTADGSVFTLPSGVTAQWTATPNQATLAGSSPVVTAVPSITTPAGSYVVTYKAGGLTFSGGDAAAQTLVNSYVLVPFGAGVNWTVDKAQVKVSAPTVTTVYYSGSTAATLAASSTLTAVNNNAIGGTGVRAGDDVTLNQATSGSFVSKNAAAGIAVTYTDTLTGAQAGNYELVQDVATGTILPAPLKVINTTVTPRTYDGTTNATVTGGSLRADTNNPITTTTGVLSGDASSVHLVAATSGTFGCANVGCTAVTVVDSLTGSAAGNYVLVQPSPTGIINPAPLTISGLSAADKNYDGTSTATINGTATLVAGAGNTIAGNGTLAADHVGLSGTTGLTGQFATVDAATHTQAVTLTDSLVNTLTSGAEPNYVLVVPTLSAFINPAPLVISGTTANAKTYDGTTAATLSGGVTAPDTGNTIGGNGIYSGDAVTLVQAGTFANPNAGGAQTVVVADTLAGAKAHDYVLTQPGSVSAAISPAPLTVSGTQVGTKTYDGTDGAALFGGTLAAGTGNTLGGNGVYSGDAANVSLTTVSSGHFASVNASPSAQSVAAADTLNLTGSALGNYVLVQPVLSGFITPAPLTVSGLSAANKVYDGTTLATLAGTAALVPAAGNTIAGNGVLAGDASGVTLVASTSGVFASANASASPQAVATSDSLTLSGSAVGDYVLVQPAALTATISRAQLSVSGTSVAGKTYNGSTAASLTGGTLAAGGNNLIGTSSGVYGSDDVTLVQGGNFASPNASANPQAVVSTDALAGAAAGNYVLAAPTGLSATIAPAPLTVSGTSVANHTYDGTTVATLSGGALASGAGNTIGGNGVLSADAAGVHLNTAATGTFASPNASVSAQSVGVADSLTLTGSAAGNYVLVQPTLTGFVNPAPLTASGTSVVGKTYDGTATAALQGGTLAATGSNAIGGNGVYAGDVGNVVFTAATTGTFAGVNANAGAQAVTIVDGLVLTGSAVGNYVFVQPAATGTIAPAPLTVNGTTVASKTYTGTSTATLSGGALGASAGNTIGGNGVLGSDAGNLSLVLAPTGTFASVNASGSAQAVTVSDTLSGSASGNYVLVQPALSGFINPAPLTVSGSSVATRTYDGTTVAAINGGALAPSSGNTLGGDGVLASDASSVHLVLAATGHYAAPDAGANARSVTVADSLVLTGPAAGNYVLVQPTLSGLVTQAPITVTGTTVVTKTYNGNNQATLVNGTFAPVSTGTASTSNTIAGNGVVAADLAHLTLNQAGTFAGSNASGSAQAVTAADSLGGSAAANYVLVEPTALAGFINPAPLTVGNTIVTSRTYNGSNAATVSGGQLVAGAGNTIGGSGVLSADAANVHLTTVTSGTFASANASSTPQAVTVADTLAVSGSAAGNYVLVEPALTGTINPAPLTVTGSSVTGKTYDGTRTATLTGGALAPVHTGNAASSDTIATASGVLASDAANVQLVQGANFASANAGAAAQAVSASDSLVLSGAAAGNYVLVQPAGLSGVISPAPVTVSGATVVDRTYNGTTTATFTGGTLAPAAGNTIGGSGVVAADAANLRLTQGGNFASANASPNAQAVTATDALFGSASPNYVLVEPTGLAGTISPAPLTVSGTTVATRTYDGTTTATLSGGTLSAATGNTIGGTGVLSADAAFVSLQTAPSGTFASPNAGTAAQSVSVTDTLTLTGSAAGNYVLLQPATLTGFINPAPLTVVGASVVDKTYDGTTLATLSGGSLAPVVNGNAAASNNIATPSGVLAADAGGVVLNSSGNFASSNANSAAQAVAVHDTLTLTGSAAGNYVLVQPANLSGTIRQATLTITAAGNVKTYDGTTNAAATPLVTGLASGTTLSGLSESYTSADVAGAGASTLVVNGGIVVNDGNFGNNYTLVTANGAGTITPATLTVINTLVGNKVYDGTKTTTVGGGVLVGLFNSDDVSLAQSGSFASANAGTAVALVGSDSISGAAASNYVLQQPTGLTGVIAPAPLTVSGTTVASKPFDGSNAATLVGGTLVGLVAGDAGSVRLNQGGTFTSTVPASSIPVLAADTLAGAGAGNYTLAEPTGLFGNITPNLLMPTAASLSVPLIDPLLNPFSERTAPLAVSGEGGASALAGTPAGTESNPSWKRRLPALAGLNISVVEDGIKLPAASGRQSP